MSSILDDVEGLVGRAWESGALEMKISVAETEDGPKIEILTSRRVIKDYSPEMCDALARSFDNASHYLRLAKKWEPL